VGGKGELDLNYLLLIEIPINGHVVLEFIFLNDFFWIFALALR
jgi:hypothetical protein